MRRKLHKACRDAADRCGGRPVPARHYHLTLAFLGNVPVALLPAIRTAATTVAPPDFELRLDRFGRFPRARVAWLGPGESPAELARLAQDLWAALVPVGLTPDPRPFRPHLSIARKILREPAVNLPRALIWRVGGFALIRSVTDPAGARYSVDQYFPKGSSNEP